MLAFSVLLAAIFGVLGIAIFAVYCVWLLVWRKTLQLRHPSDGIIVAVVLCAFSTIYWISPSILLNPRFGLSLKVACWLIVLLIAVFAIFAVSTSTKNTLGVMIHSLVTGLKIIVPVTIVSLIGDRTLMIIVFLSWSITYLVVYLSMLSLNGTFEKGMSEYADHMAYVLWSLERSSPRLVFMNYRDSVDKRHGFRGWKSSARNMRMQIWIRAWRGFIAMWIIFLAVVWR